MSIMGTGRYSMMRRFNDFFTLDNGVTPCTVEPPSSKRFNRESQPCSAPSPSVSPVRGGKARGKDDAV